VRTAAFLFAAIAIAATMAWLLRYEYYPPFTKQDLPTAANPTGRSLVACKADRWTSEIICETVVVDMQDSAAEMERWVKQREAKYGCRSASPTSAGLFISPLEIPSR
jgi:hypothetical protein